MTCTGENARDIIDFSYLRMVTSLHSAGQPRPDSLLFPVQAEVLRLLTTLHSFHARRNVDAL